MCIVVQIVQILCNFFIFQFLNTKENPLLKRSPKRLIFTIKFHEIIILGTTDLYGPKSLCVPTYLSNLSVVQCQLYKQF